MSSDAGTGSTKTEADGATESGCSTFSAIHTPNIRRQLDLLAADPPLLDGQADTSFSVKKGMFARMRRPNCHVDIEHTFKHIFLKQEFKGKQREIMEAAVKGLDILVIAPTGMGKSLCFQVPAVAEEHGLTIVITPLLSLMANQVQALEKLNIRTAMLTSRTPEDEKKRIEKDMHSGHPRNRLLYITPERLNTTSFQRLLKKVYANNELARLVIDEAHCISEWGHDFRKDYQQIGNFRQLFEKVPIMALTASATKTVQDDIITSLDMRMDRLFKVVHSFNRINLFYEVRYVQDDAMKKLEDIASFINNLYRRKAQRGDDMTEAEARAVCGIVYCRSKKSCDFVADRLRKKGINAAAFHRGLKDNENEKSARLWQNSEKLAAEGKKRVDCMVATVAFGMGIDTPGCRYVIHWDLPASFEGYYQETGRAGRDGHASRCLLYYSRQDAAALRYLGEKSHARLAKRPIPDSIKGSGKSSMEALLEYAECVTECRHLKICRYFGEKPKAEAAETYCNKFCDVCKSPAQTANLKKALDPQDLVATQMPAIQRDVDDDYSDGDGDEALSAANSPRTRSSLGGTTSADDLGKLPGFAKASELKRKLSAEDGVPAEPMFKKPLFKEDSETSLDPDDPFLQAHSLRSNTKDGFAADKPEEDRVWNPRRRPSKQSVISDDRTEEDEVESLNEDVVPDCDAFKQEEREPTPPTPPLPSLSRSPAKPASHSPRKRPALQPEDFFSEDQSIVLADPPASVDESIVVVEKLVPASDDDEDDEDIVLVETAPRAITAASRPTAPRPIGQPAHVRSVMGSMQITSKTTGLGNMQITSRSTGLGNMTMGNVRSGLVGSVSAGPGKASNSGFKVPFRNPEDRPGFQVHLDPVHVDIPDGKTIKFALTPDRWQKKVDKAMRETAVRQIYALLNKAFLASAGLRARCEEDELFEKLRIPTSTLRQREETLLFASLELESDNFWRCLGAPGYKTATSQSTKVIQSLLASHMWLDTFPGSSDVQSEEVFQAVQRAIKYRRIHVKQQDKYTSSSESEAPEQDDAIDIDSD